MPQQKISWTYTTQYHLEGEKGLFFPISSRSSVTATATDYPWTIDSDDTTQPTTLLRRRTSRAPRYMDDSSRTKHDKTPDILSNRKCYGDLAFSPDPLANPLFISSLTPTWCSSPGPGHPTLQKQRQVVGGEEIYPPQPPNTPEPKAAAADNRSQSHRPATTDNNDTPPSADSTLLVPAVQLPHVQRMPHRASPPPSLPQCLQQTPSPKPDPKKRQGFFSRLLGSLSGTESSQSGRPRTIPALQPVPAPRHHPQSLHRPERPLMPQHTSIARTHAEMSNPPIVPAAIAAAAAERAAEDRRLRQDLDRIDELDETNPFGQAIHHGGPYEAVSRIVQKDTTSGFDKRPLRNEAIGTQNLIMSGDVYRFVQLMALQTSLNLRPGQILLHGFVQPTQLDLQPSLHSDYPQPDSDWHHGPQQQPVMNHSQYIQSGLPTSESRRLVERPVYPQKVPSVLHSEASLRSLPTMASAPSSTDIPLARPKTPSLSVDNPHMDDTGFAIGMAMMSFGQNNLDTTADSATFVGIGGEPNSPVPIKIGLHEPADPNEDNPPPYASDFPTTSTSQIVGSLLLEHRSQELPPVDWSHMEDSLSVMPQFQAFPDQVHSSQFVPDPDPAPPASLSRHTYWHPQPSQVIHPRPCMRSNRRNVQPSPQNIVASNPGLNRSSTYTPGFSGSSTNHHIPIPASLKPISGTLLPSSLRDKESDNRSVQQSVITNSNVSSRSLAGNPRKNHYLPKHLVMPAPLQPMIQNQATMQQVRFDPQVNVISPLAQAPSPFHAKASTSNLQLHQAQEAQSNGKLRKRSSLFGRIKEPPQPPVTTVSFSANIVPTDRHARGVEKVHKKVLNKKK